MLIEIYPTAFGLSIQEYEIVRLSFGMKTVWVRMLSLRTVPLQLLFLSLLFGRGIALLNSGGPATFTIEQKFEDRSVRARDLNDVEETFLAMVNALEAMQSLFWDQGTSTWPTGID